MSRSTIHIVLLISIVPFFIFGCDNNNSGISSDTKDELFEINPNVVENPKNLEYYKEEQTINNCASGKLTHIFTTSTFIRKSLNISNTASVGGSVGVEIPSIVKADLEGEITQGYQNLFEQANKEEYQVAKEIPEWHIMKIKVKLQKRMYESKATYKKGEKIYTVPYQYILNIPIPHEVKFKNVKCPNQPGSVEIIPSYKRLEVGESFQLKAELLDTENKVLNQKNFTWKSRHPNIATVSRDGQVNTQSEGKTTITATAKNISGEARIDVKQTVRRVTIKPSKITIRYGENINLDADVIGSNEIRLDKKIKWSTSNDKIVSIYQDGIAEGQWIGTATITANCEGIKGVAQITVSPPQIPFPEHNILIIVPFGAGGTSDTVCRLMASHLAKQVFKKRIDVVVVNRTGSGGFVGWKNTLSFNADGYTLTIYNKALPLTGNPGLDDFYPIAMFAKDAKTKKYGLLSPKGTPDEVIAVLEHAIKTVVYSDTYKDDIQRYKLSPYFVSAIDFKRQVQK